MSHHRFNTLFPVSSYPLVLGGLMFTLLYPFRLFTLAFFLMDLPRTFPYLGFLFSFFVAIFIFPLVLMSSYVGNNAPFSNTDTSLRWFLTFWTCLLAFSSWILIIGPTSPCPLTIYSMTVTGSDYCFVSRY